MTLTITDDDLVELSVDDVSVAEGDSGSTTLEFTVTLSPAATVEVTVDWATADGTAQAGTDYTSGSGSLTFGVGETSKTVTVSVTGDDVDEPKRDLHGDAVERGGRDAREGGGGRGRSSTTTMRPRSRFPTRRPPRPPIWSSRCP